MGVGIKREGLLTENWVGVVLALSSYHIVSSSCGLTEFSEWYNGRLIPCPVFTSRYQSLVSHWEGKLLHDRRAYEGGN